jgi:hypothetical protein
MECHSDEIVCTEVVCERKPLQQYIYAYKLGCTPVKPVTDALVGKICKIPHSFIPHSFYLLQIFQDTVGNVQKNRQWPPTRIYRYNAGLLSDDET